MKIEYACISLSVLLGHLSALIIGVVYQDDPCQEPDWLTLGSWLQGVGISGLVIISIFPLFALLAQYQKSYKSFIWIAIILSLDVVFCIIWAILGGIIIFAGGSKDCVYGGTPMGYITILLMLFWEPRFLFFHLMRQMLELEYDFPPASSESNSPPSENRPFAPLSAPINSSVPQISVSTAFPQRTPKIVPSAPPLKASNDQSIDMPS